VIGIENDPIVESSQDSNTLEYKSEAKSPGRKVQRMQNLLKKGRANLSRSKSELGEHNKKILQHLNKGKSGLTEHNKKLLANIRLKKIEVGKIIPYSFSKIRQEQEELQQVDQDVDLSFGANMNLELHQIECLPMETVTLDGEELDPLSSSLSHLDLLDTVLADFTRGKLKSCDNADNYNVILEQIEDKLDENIEDLEPIESKPIHDINWIDSGVENVPIIKQSSIDEFAADIDSQVLLIGSKSAYTSNLSENYCDETLISTNFKSRIESQSRLSDSFCDEIFTELERTATFPRHIDWIDAFTGESNEYKKTEIPENQIISIKDDWKELYDVNSNNKIFEAFEDTPVKNTIKENSTPPTR